MLTPKKKLTKKELKRDPLLDSLEKGKEFYEKYSNQIVSAIGALVVILLLGWGWMNSRETTNNEAMLANTKATIAAAAGLDENVVAELEKIVDEYGSNSNVTQSLFQLGIAKINDGDYDGAKELFTRLASNSDELTKRAGKLKLAYINEKQSNYVEAASRYMEVAALDAGIVSKYAKLQAGYAFLNAEQHQDAELIVSDLLAENPTGKFKEYVKYLEGKVLEK
ncbi:tetratricopeptide repeat protein [bacterium]|nr:tetratricopeptide repeat protein [bacterium]